MSDDKRVLLTVPFRVVEADVDNTQSKHIRNITETEDEIVIRFGKSEMTEEPAVGEDDGYYDEDKPKSMKAVDEDIIIEGPVSSGMRDRDGDIVEPEAVMAAWDRYKMNPIIRFNHGRNGIGVMEDVRLGEWPGIDHKVPIGRARIDGGEKDIVRKIRKGILRAFSIGFIARASGVKQECDPENEKDCWYRFNEIEWIETSVVDVPANPVSLFDVVKNMEMFRPKATDMNSENLINPFSVVVFQTTEEKTMSTEEIHTEDPEMVVDEVSIDEELPVVESPTNYEILYEQVQELKDMVHTLLSTKAEETDDEPAEEELAEEPAEEAEEELTEELPEEELTEEAPAEEALDKSVDDESTNLKATIAELEAKVAANEREKEIEAEVQRRVDEALANPTRNPTRKSMRDDTPLEVASDEEPEDPHGRTVGEVAAAKWLGHMLATRGI